MRPYWFNWKVIYDPLSNKVIIITSNILGKDNGGYIYDIRNNSITECQNLFNSYPTTTGNTMVDVNEDGNYDILDIIQMGNKEFIKQNNLKISVIKTKK